MNIFVAVVSYKRTADGDISHNFRAFRDIGLKNPSYIVWYHPTSISHDKPCRYTLYN